MIECRWVIELGGGGSAYFDLYAHDFQQVPLAVLQIALPMKSDFIFKEITKKTAHVISSYNLLAHNRL